MSFIIGFIIGFATSYFYIDKIKEIINQDKNSK